MAADISVGSEDGRLVIKVLNALSDANKAKLDSLLRTRGLIFLQQQ